MALKHLYKTNTGEFNLDYCASILFKFGSYDFSATSIGPLIDLYTVTTYLVANRKNPLPLVVGDKKLVLRFVVLEKLKKR